MEWKCHICGKVRSDYAISVKKKPLIVDGQDLGEENIRYCNDNSECYEGAETFSFLKNKD